MAEHRPSLRKLAVLAGALKRIEGCVDTRTRKVSWERLLTEHPDDLVILAGELIEGGADMPLHDLLERLLSEIPRIANAYGDYFRDEVAPPAVHLVGVLTKAAGLFAPEAPPKQ